METKEYNKFFKLKILAITCLIAGAMAVLLCVYQSCVVYVCDFSSMTADAFGIRRFGEFFLFFESLLLFVVIVRKERLFKYRYLIAMLCFITCVAMELTGSSIGCFAGEAEQNLLLGVSRHLRSDEWAILTPMTWTQYLDPNGTFSYYNSVVRAEPTDVFLEYGLPIYSPLMMFKPFLLGYLFLPIAKGMAFFWCGRLIALAMISFEFGRYITNDNRLLAFVYSVMVVFSPTVQWWFAINGFVEMLFFFQLSLLCLDRYLKTDNSLRRWMYAVIIGMCAGGYALTMYPAWMIPIAYVLLGCIIWVFYNNHVQGTIKTMTKSDLISIAFVLCMLIFSFAHVYSNSHETIATIANTVYPGHRLEFGGVSSVKDLFSFIPSIFYAVGGGSAGVNGNVCECAYFICLFPAGYLMFFYRLLKKKRDSLCTIMVIISILLMVYSVFGLQDKLATISLLKYSKSNRTLVAWSFANVILLIRLISLISEERAKTETGKSLGIPTIAKSISFVIMCGLAVLGIWEAYQLNPAIYSYNKYMIIVEAIIFIPLYALLSDSSRRGNTFWAICMISACLISTALANPVRMGVDDIKNNSSVQMIRQVVDTDPQAIWIVEGDGFAVTNLPLLAGARTINCTNIYPDLERWRKIDPKGEYDNCYNRYGHIQVIRKNDNSEKQKFVLNSTLSYTVCLSDKEMKSLGVNYILSSNDLKGNNMRLISTNGSFNVYYLK